MENNKIKIIKHSSGYTLFPKPLRFDIYENFCVMLTGTSDLNIKDVERFIKTM